MDANTLAGLIASFGFPGAMMIYYLVDSKKKEEKMQQRMEAQILEMKIEGKEDKKMFMVAIETFNKTIDSIGDIKKEVGEVKVDIAEVNNKVDQILFRK